MLKILFFAHDPGGANAIKPLIEPLNKKGFKCLVYGKGPALKILPNVIEYSGDTDKLIESIKPNFIITGTSASDMTEKELRLSAQKCGIECLAILDSWVNYNRFTKYSTKELAKNKKYSELSYLPTYLIVMDEYAKNEAIKESVPKNIIYPLGNPHFEYIKNSFKALNVDELRKSLLKGKQKLIVWASEPYIEDYGKGMEIECLKDLIEVVPNDTHLIIKPHPREKLDKFDKFKGIAIVRDMSSLQMIKAADLVLSMTSMVLIESIIANKATLSYQKNETDNEKFILTKMKALPFINDKFSLKKEIEERLKFHNKINLQIKFNATENIIKFIEERLCQN